MSRKPLVYMVSQPEYVRPFLSSFNLTNSPEEADVLFFTGGEDVSPHLYGENPGVFTFTNPYRDHLEVQIFKAFPDKKKLGVCRGAQFLCVMSGGKLIQHVKNHTRWHNIETKGGKTYFISSTHHQMMLPGKVKHELIAWAKARSEIYWDGNQIQIQARVKDNRDPEIVYFPKTKSLCIQGHPEYMPEEAPVIPYVNKLVKQYLY